MDPSGEREGPMTDLPYVLEAQTPEDAEAIVRLNDRVFGPGRFARTAYRLRETTPPDLSLSCVAWIGPLLVGANAMTPIFVGESPAYLLGPLIVEPVFRSQGIGEALVKRSLDRARDAGARLVILVGDEPYYGRLGFVRTPPKRLEMPGPVDPARVLYCELQQGAFEGVGGKVRGA
jgi:predicted N-acetyltransferase YhbS